MVPARPFFIGKPRLGAVERLDLGLLVYRQHDGVLRRVEIQANHVLELLGKARIVRQFEGRHQMRLQAMGLPDRVNARRRDAHRLGHRSQAPVCGVRRRLCLGLRDDPGDHCRAERRLARRARLVAAQAVHASLNIARSPAPNRRPAHSQAPLNHGGSHPVASQQHDLCATDMLLWRIAVGDQRLQPVPIPGRQLDPHFLAHDHILASNPPAWNLLLRPEH